MRTTLLVSALAFSLASCATAPPASTDLSSRRAVNEALDLYFSALRTGAIDPVPLARSIRFVGPMQPQALVGQTEVKQFLKQVSAGVRAVKEERRIIDGNDAAVTFVLELQNGIALPICDYFRFAHGQIVEIRPYFDPRLLVQSDSSP